ncbi:MAG TPA: type II toxin-antitoxin system RelE/ParE family toxin [Candidatus Saccharimonadales bacterium]|nr:type II toxin-antitoxin system RelE/ParE family toxin [Candidatus Saccharimonadales bacterium]
MYVITYRRSVKKELEKLGQASRTAIVKKILSLAADPRPAGCRKLRESQDLYRIRYGNYRIIYQIQDKTLIIVIIKVGHRKEIYRGL